MTTAAIAFRLGPAVRREQIPALCAALADLLRAHAGAAVVCDVGALTRPDVATAEALARLRLTARRHGRQLVVRGAGPELLGLLDLLGLRELLGLGGGRATNGPGAPGLQPAASDQVGGQAEEREQPPGVEEVGDPGDPPR